MKSLLSSLAVLLSLVLAQTVSAAFIPADPTEGESYVRRCWLFNFFSLESKSWDQSLVVYIWSFSFPAEAISLSPQVAGELVATEVPR